MLDKTRHSILEKRPLPQLHTELEYSPLIQVHRQNGLSLKGHIKTDSIIFYMRVPRMHLFCSPFTEQKGTSQWGPLKPGACTCGILSFVPFFMDSLPSVTFSTSLENGFSLHTGFSSIGFLHSMSLHDAKFSVQNVFCCLNCPDLQNNRKTP